MGVVITISGAVGGIGTSTLAYAVARQRPGGALLVDAQLSGAPLDLLTGIETEPGTRWHQIHVSSAAIEAGTIFSALPAAGGAAVLSASRLGVVQPIALTHLVEATRSVCDLVVVDIDLRSPVIDLLQPDLRVVTLPATILGIGAAVGTVAASCELVVMRSMYEDFLPTTLTQYVPHPVLGVVEHERAVWQSLRARQAPPDRSSVMQVAERITERVLNAA